MRDLDEPLDHSDPLEYLQLNSIQQEKALKANSKRKKERNKKSESMVVSKADKFVIRSGHRAIEYAEKAKSYKQDIQSTLERKSMSTIDSLSTAKDYLEGKDSKSDRNEFRENYRNLVEYETGTPPDQEELDQL